MNFINPSVIGMMIPILIFLIPIIAILTSHQQKMAQIYREGAQRLGANDADLIALREEMRQLRELVQQQAIVLDNIAMLQTRSADLPPQAPLETRLSP